MKMKKIMSHKLHTKRTKKLTNLLHKHSKNKPSYTILKKFLKQKMYEQMIENWAEARINILTSWSRVKMERLHFNARDHVIADPDVFLNADPEPGAFSMRIRIKLKIYLTKSVVYSKT